LRRASAAGRDGAVELEIEIGIGIDCDPDFDPDTDFDPDFDPDFDLDTGSSRSSTAVLVDWRRPFEVVPRADADCVNVAK
jgi:hypothetical protein